MATLFNNNKTLRQMRMLIVLDYITNTCNVHNLNEEKYNEIEIKLEDGGYYDALAEYVSQMGYDTDMSNWMLADKITERFVDEFNK